jgi:predicted ATPase
MNKVKIHLNSFKCFEDITFYLNNITFLTGANATGKSSLIQALLLADAALAESEHEIVKIQLYDPERALDLGKVDNLINNKGLDKVCIDINDTALEFRGDDEVGDGFLLMRCNSLDSESGKGLGRISYLNAERIGPRRETEIDNTRKQACGCHGNHTASVILNNEFTKIPTNKCYPTNGTTETNFRIALDSWVRLIFPDITIHVVATGNTKCQIMVNNENLGIKNIATNAGFGISYVLPILVTCLLAKDEETIIIENPEAHLHAKAQSNMGYFLGVMAAAGMRIIVETHSEHIINGIRRTIACSDILAPEAVTIYFFDAEDGRIQQTEISIDKEGNLSKFPVDFFDQQRQDSKAIFECLHLRQ